MDATHCLQAMHHRIEQGAEDAWPRGFEFAPQFVFEAANTSLSTLTVLTVLAAPVFTRIIRFPAQLVISMPSVRRKVWLPSQSAGKPACSTFLVNVRQPERGINGSPVRERVAIS